MDYIDKEIILSSEEDFTEIFSLVSFISRELDLSWEDAVANFFTRCDGIREYIPLDMFHSQVLYGEMELVKWHHLSRGELVNDQGEISGAPFYYVRIVSDAPIGFFSDIA